MLLLCCMNLMRQMSHMGCEQSVKGPFKCAGNKVTTMQPRLYYAVLYVCTFGFHAIHRTSMSLLVSTRCFMSWHGFAFIPDGCKDWFHAMSTIGGALWDVIDRCKVSSSNCMKESIRFSVISRRKLAKMCHFHPGWGLPNFMKWFLEGITPYATDWPELLPLRMSSFIDGVAHACRLLDSHLPQGWAVVERSIVVVGGGESILRWELEQSVVEAAFDATVIGEFAGSSMCDARNDGAELCGSTLCTRLHFDRQCSHFIWSCPVSLFLSQCCCLYSDG